MSLPDMIVRGEGTVSDRIRALAVAGYPRADIARILNKRYQHVRNVLEADAAKGRHLPTVPTPHAAPAAELLGTVLRMRLNEDGSVVLPAEVLAKFGFKPGGLVIGEVKDETIVIPSRAENRRRIREELRRYIPEGVDGVGGLIAERRRENAKDETGE